MMNTVVSNEAGIGPNESAAGLPSASGREIRRIAVIIPLEYHRGLAVSCIRGWTREQDYPREHYQVLAGAPADFDPVELDAIRAELQEGDELLILDHVHDMNLVEATASRANAELLLFSESHCVPHPDALRYLAGVAENHPDWDAFSAPTHGLTHNLLSSVECEIYSTDIRGKLGSHDWLRVLDQCFVIRRKAYDTVGGFRGEFGHFAEWLFAASMRVHGLKLGVADRAVVDHGYIGDYEDLEEFTVDFAQGQIRYLCEHGDEPAAALFPSIPELDEHLGLTDEERARVGRYASRDRWRVLFVAFRKWLHRDSTGPLQAYLAWARTLCSLENESFDSQFARATEDAARARNRLDGAIQAGDRVAAHHLFVEWFARLVRQGRMAYLAENRARLEFRAGERTLNFARSGGWHASEESSLAKLFRLHDAEGTADGTIRWSLPTFQILLPLHEGNGRYIRIEWTRARPLNRTDLIKVRFDGRAVGAGAVQLSATALTVTADVDVSGWHELAVSVYPFQGGHDSRLLGLPLRSVHWMSEDPVTPRRLSDDTPSNYFLHVPKCGGTTMSTILENGFGASDCFSPYLGAYYPADFDIHPRSGTRAPVYIGHFGWTVPAAFPEGRIRVSTMLRDPIDRLLSLFHYFRQHRRIHAGLSFEEWARGFIRFQNTMTSHFVVGNQDGEASGGAAVQALAEAVLDEAIGNLRRCAVVGLSEELEDSLNLFAKEMGFLPPERVSRYNVTERRTAVSSLSPDFRRQLEQWLAPDYALYAEAKRLFDRQRGAMYSALLGSAAGRTPDAARAALRRAYLENLANDTRGQNGYFWSADDVFHGENLHPREYDGIQALRWTGPESQTEIYLPGVTGGAWVLEIGLHAAAPTGRVNETTLSVDDRPLAYSIYSHPRGQSVLRAYFERSGEYSGCRPVARLTLTVPTQLGVSEFRKLGLPLIWLKIMRKSPQNSSENIV